MGNIQALFNTFFNILNIDFTIGNMSFNLFDVFIASLILSVIGLFIGKIIFFLNNER